MAWVAGLPDEDLREILLLKNSRLLRPYAKFLIVLCKYEGRDHYTNILKEVVGGGYITYTKEALLAGLVEYQRGKPPRLTERGRALCPALLECWSRLKQAETQLQNQGS